MRTVQVSGAGFGPVVAGQASTFNERLRGLAASGALPALLIETSSIHTFGLGSAIGVVGLDEDMNVVAARMVAPNRAVWLRGSRWILEVPEEIPLPDVGDELGLVDDG